MEDAEKVIAHLRNEIKLRDKDIHLAATYGKQLFEEKAELNLKFEELNSVKEAFEQDKHSLQLELETQNHTVRSLTTELDFQRDRADDLLEKLHSNEKENDAMHKKIQNLLKENQYFKKLQEDLCIENKSLKDKICLQGKQIQNFEEQAEKSICEVEKDENTELISQLNTYMLNNKEVQDALSQVQCELQMAKKNENHLLQMVKDLEEAVSDRDADIRTYITELKKTKEEMEELQAEIEVLKFDKVDINRRGNSVFAELDDRRNLVEREYKLLQKKFEHFQKNYEVNKTELDRARGQMAILQSIASRDYQQTFIDKLEDSLSAAKQEIQDLTHKLSKAIKDKVEIVTEDKTFSSKDNQYGYLRVMLKQSQIKEKELQNEVMNLRMKNMHDNNKLTETQHLLYKAREDLDSAKQEISKLKLKMKEMEQGICEKKIYDNEARKPNVEVFEVFKPKSRGEKNDKLDKTMINFHPDMSVIPGELELDDDGFRQIKPPRKSNKFILQEFNRLEVDEGTMKNVTIHTGKNELKERNNEKEQNDQNERQRLKNRSHSKVSSRRDDNCKQQ